MYLPTAESLEFFAFYTSHGQFCVLPYGYEPSIFTNQALFGFEDAESESIDWLKEYHLKKDTYDRVAADLPVRILVGHKGTGKSALFKVAMSEEQEKGNLPILIKPDDIAELGKDNENFLLRISNGNMD